MKYWQAAIWFIGALIFQPFLYNLAPGFGITPNLILCLTVIFTFLYEDKLFGIILGSTFGLIYDICYGQFVGVAAFDLALVATIILILREWTNVENIFTVVVIGLISTWFYNTVYWVIMHFAGSPYGYLFVLSKMPWYALLNLIVIMIVYFILIKRVVKHRRDRYFQ